MIYASSRRIAQRLVANGMKVNVRDNNGITPLSNALNNAMAGKGPEFEDVALFMLEQGAPVNFNFPTVKTTALHRSARGGQLRVVKRHLERKLISVDALDSD